MQKGWEFSAHLTGSNVAASVGNSYVEEVNSAIDALAKEIVNLKSGQSEAVLGGYIAEHWHAGTFNVAATAAGSTHRATTLGSTEFGSVDIATNFGVDYSSKYMATGEKSAVAQAAFSRELGLPKYHGQERLIPSDQIDDAMAIAIRRTNSNSQIRPEIAASYNEVSHCLTDRVSDGQGIESIPLTKADNLEMARQVKNEEFLPEKFGASLDNAIKPQYVVEQALKAGYTTAAITVVMQMAPEIFKAVDYLVKTGKINLQQVRKMGTKAISASAEGFLRGSISCSVLIMCEKGMLGDAFRGINPTILGTVVAIALETVKNSILVASGRMSAKEMGAAFTDGLVISAGFLLGNKIGGIIGQALGVQLPVFGYLLGSFIGCTFATIYDISKKKLISFCADTGFTCFGLVDQNYELPEEILDELGIELIPIKRVPISRTEIKRSSISQADIRKVPFNADNYEYETVNVRVLRRGVIGINKIGYTL